MSICPALCVTIPSTTSPTFLPCRGLCDLYLSAHEKHSTAYPRRKALQAHRSRRQGTHPAQGGKRADQGRTLPAPGCGGKGGDRLGMDHENWAGISHTHSSG